MTNQLTHKLQKIQNSCIRFTFGLRKYDRITNFRISKNILSMQNRRLLHCLTLMFKIVKKIAPVYLCDKITYHNSLHNYNTRNKNDILTPFARTRYRTLSFFIEISKQFNIISQVLCISDLSLYAFKIKCKKYLTEKETLSLF